MNAGTISSSDHQPIPDGEGPVDDAARERGRAIRQDPKHRRPVGHPDDVATIDDDLKDPKKQKED